jgi:hypothetical protein
VALLGYKFQTGRFIRASLLALNMLTRQHYRKIAAAIAAVESPTEKARVYMALIDMCRESNPRFDEDKFWDACDFPASFGVLINGVIRHPEN